MLINFDVELSEFLLHITEMDLLSLLMTVKIIAVSVKRNFKFSDSRNIFYIPSSTVNRQAIKNSKSVLCRIFDEYFSENLSQTFSFVISKISSLSI